MQYLEANTKHTYYKLFHTFVLQNFFHLFITSTYLKRKKIHTHTYSLQGSFYFIYPLFEYLFINCYTPPLYTFIRQHSKRTSSFVSLSLSIEYDVLLTCS